MQKFLKAAQGVMLVLFTIVFLSAVFTWPVKIIINYLFTKQMLLLLFGIPQFTFWKAYWLSFLCGILFKGSGK